MNSSRLSAFCDRALEAGWLLGVTITPVFFNVYSSRVFEPDKLTTLRSLAVVMAILWLVRLLDEVMHGGKPLRFSWHTPMVLPALATMTIYLISSAFSLVPFTSFIGSYQRLQGTYTLSAYLVLFFAVLTGLRTRAQLSRLITVLILNSLPISLYGIIQHNGLDPLPWAGDVTSRVASNMGNAIFVAAYLILIVPLTAARIIESFNDIMHRDKARVSDILRASGYIFLMAVQLLTIWYSQSRGPWLGLVAAGFVFPFLALILLQKQALAEVDVTDYHPWKDVLMGLGFGVGTLALAGAAALLPVMALSGVTGMYVGLGLAALLFCGGWLYMVVERKGWRWLWIAWGTVGLSIAVTLVAINMPGPLQDQVLKIKSISRLATITQLEGGTGKVRTLIWEGAMDLIGIHDPIRFPDGSADRWNALRPLIGYGPESMYVAYNSFYPAELGHYESRTASPDRSHNETLDSVVITGALGLLAYLFTFGSVFYWGFRWLGLIKSRGQMLMYLGLMVFSAVALFLVGWKLDGLHLFAVAIPLGIMVGTMIYLALQAFLRQLNPASLAANGEMHPHALLIVAIVAAALAHLVEINFGIAIASTRTTFWVYAAMLVCLGQLWIPALNGNGADAVESVPEESLADSSRRVRQRRAPAPVRVTRGATWLVSVVALSLVATFLLCTLAFDFVNNPARLTNGGEIFSRSLTARWDGRTQTWVSSGGGLMIFAFTWLLFGLVGLSEFDREGLFDEDRLTTWGGAILIYGGITLLGLLLFGNSVAGLQAGLTQTKIASIEDVVNVGVLLASLVGQYYALIFFLVVVMGLTLLGEDYLPASWGQLASLGVLGVLLWPGIYFITRSNYDLIRADIIYKQGAVYAGVNSANEKSIGIRYYEKALEYTPQEDYYYLFLGKAYLELAQVMPETTSIQERALIFEKTEKVLNDARTINPLNTDHSANLARFYKSWASRVALDARQEGLADATKFALDAQRGDLIQQALANYQTALVLSPHNPILWNELALLYSLDLNDAVQAGATISKSLEVDPGFEQTWQLLGDMRSTQGDYTGAIEAYSGSLKLRENCTVRRAVGTLYAQQQDWFHAIASLQNSLEICATASEAWDLHRVLAIAYANTGQITEGIQSANQALMLAPESQKPFVEQLVAQLNGQLQLLQEP